MTADRGAQLLLMQIRRHRREIVSSDVELPAHIPGPDQVLDGHALRNWVWTALEALTEEERVTLVLRYFTRCDRYQAIAAITGVPVDTVRSRLNRARRRLLDVLGTDAGPQHHQAELEASRCREWASFYQELHVRPSRERTATSTTAMSPFRT